MTTLLSVGMLDLSPIPSVVLVPDGWIIWHNEAARAVLPTPNDRPLLGRDLEAVVEVEPGIVQRWLRSDRPSRTATYLPATASTNRGVGAELHAVRLENGSVLVQITAPSQPSEPDTGDGFRRALLELSEMSQDGLDDSLFFRTLLRRAVDVVPNAQAGSVLLRSGEDSDRYEFVAAEGFGLRALQRYPIAADELLRDAETPAASITYELDNSALEPERRAWLQRFGRTDEIRTSVSVPVLLDGDAVAFISLNNFERRDAFDDDAVQMTTLLGRLVADLIRRRRLEQELRHERESFRYLAHHDPLTGLANRRHVEMVLDDAIAAAGGSNVPMAVLYIDLDDFKSVNDSFGHDIGDQVLVAVAERLRQATRRTDLLGRWGGDEFVLLALDCADEASAIGLGERLVAALEAPIEIDDHRSLSCGVSIGAIWTRDGSGGTHALLTEADQALYDAKLTGKGRVRVRAA